MDPRDAERLTGASGGTVFIELAEFLRCPACRAEQTPLIVAPDVMADRVVRAGQVGCAACRREFAIEEGIVRFGVPPTASTDGALPDEASPEGIRALLGLGGPGGFAVLLGGAGRLAGGLAERLPGIHWVAVNPPSDIVAAPAVSVLYSAVGIPLRTGTMRGSVVGPDAAAPAWLAEAARVVLRGLRLVVFGAPEAVEGVEVLASSAGVWVGERT